MPIRSGGMVPFASPASCIANWQPIDAELDGPGHRVERPAVRLFDERLGGEVADLAGHLRGERERVDAGDGADTAECRRASADQNAAGPDPIGLITPNPVSTVRREWVVMSVTRLDLTITRPHRSIRR